MSQAQGLLSHWASDIERIFFSRMNDAGMAGEPLKRGSALVLYFCQIYEAENASRPCLVHIACTYTLRRMSK